MTSFYVYALYRDEACLHPFYVGKGKGLRMHEHEILRKHDRNPYKKNVIRKVVAELGFLPKKMLHENLEESAAFKLERHWIAFWGRADKKQGPLVNLTDGGEGTSGKLYTAEQRAYQSAIRKGKAPPPRTPEQCAKISARLKGRPKTLAHRENLRQALLGRSWPALALERAAAKTRGVKKSESYCKNLREKLTGRIKTPAHRAALSAAKKGKRQTPEVYARQVASRARTMAGKPGPNAGRIFTADERANMSRAHVDAAYARIEWLTSPPS